MLSASFLLLINTTLFLSSLLGVFSISGIVTAFLYYWSWVLFNEGRRQPELIILLPATASDVDNVYITIGDKCYELKHVKYFTYILFS